jgi:hypothetical protein
MYEVRHVAFPGDFDRTTRTLRASSRPVGDALVYEPPDVGFGQGALALRRPAADSFFVDFGQKVIDPLESLEVMPHCAGSDISDCVARL